MDVLHITNRNFQSFIFIINQGSLHLFELAQSGWIRLLITFQECSSLRIYLSVEEFVLTFNFTISTILLFVELVQLISEDFQGLKAISDWVRHSHNVLSDFEFNLG